MAVMGLVGGRYALDAQSRREADRIQEHQALVREHAALTEKAERIERERRELAAILERLRLERRMADVEVLQQHRDDQGRVRQTVVRFTEMGRDGRPLPPLVIGVPGGVPHFDALVLKFSDDCVEQGDALRGHSLALFRRIYSESQAPEDGYWLGRPGDVPDIYRTSPEPSEFEIELWQHFWSYATNPEKAAEASVRVAQGEAVYAPMSTGERWHLTLEADGGLNLIKTHNDDAVIPASRPSDPEPDQHLHAPSPLTQE
jgi:hypothetical protein